MEKRLKDIKLVVFDLDGTLLREDGTIGNETKELVKELKTHGVKFSFASGRLFSALKKYAEELNLDEPLITLDGSYIRSVSDHRVLHESSIKIKHIIRVYNYASRFLVNLALCHADAIYYTENNLLIPQILDKFGAKYEEVDDYAKVLSGTLEVVLAGDNKDTMKFIQSKMSSPYCFGINTSYFKSQTYNDIYYLELRRKGNSKGTGFSRLCKHLNIRQENAAVIGDWYNDISLFNTKAVKVAVQNAVPEIKYLAEIITDRTNNQDGVAEFLELILKSKKNNL